MRFRSFHSKLFASMGAVVLGSACLSVAGVGILMQRFARNETTRSLEAGRIAFDGFWSLRHELLSSKSRAIAQAPHLRATLTIDGLDAETARHTASRLLDVVESSVLVLLGPDGTVLAEAGDASSSGVEATMRPGISEVLRGEETVAVWHTSTTAYLVSVSPVVIGAQVVGAIALGETLDDASAGDIARVTHQDAFLLRPNAVIAQSLVASRVGAEQFEKIEHARRDSRSKDEHNETVELEPGRFAISIPLDERGTTLVLSRSIDPMTALYREQGMWLGLIGLLSAIVALSVSRVLSKHFCRPIFALHSASQRLAEGDLQAAVPEEGSDEVGQLAAAFNRMARHIERLVEDGRDKAKDLEARKDDLQAALLQAESASAAKSRFLANMSHELRTPMNGVLGTLDLVSNTGLGERQLRLLRIAQRSGRVLLDVIKDILDFSKIEAGKMELESVPCDPCTPVEEAVVLLNEVAESKGVQLACLTGAGVPSSIQTDPYRLRQVLVNLVGNAIKFTHRGEVEVRVHLVSTGQSETRLRYEVADSGIGIPPDKIASIFEAFSQAEDSTTRSHGGTGLGLTISAEIVSRMGGELSCSSQIGHGATFWFDVDPGSDRVRGDDISSLRGTKVLLVGSLGSNAHPLSRQLREWGLDARAEPNPMPSNRLDPDIDIVFVPGTSERRLIQSRMPEAARLVVVGRSAEPPDEAGPPDATIGVPILPSELRDVLRGTALDIPRTTVSAPQDDHHPSEGNISFDLDVLVCEDNVVNQVVITESLEALRCRVDVVGNGAEALEAISRKAYDLVMMDCHMPQMDGFEATRRIRDKESESTRALANRRLIVLALTADATEGARESCLAAGMDSYLSKPFTLSQLTEKLTVLGLGLERRYGTIAT